MKRRPVIVAILLAFTAITSAGGQVYLRSWDNTWVLTNIPRPDFVKIRQFRASHKDEYRKLVRQAAEKYGIRYELLDALIIAESNYDPRCVSNKGAVGLAQLMPKTAAGLGVNDSFDPAQNIDGGARYLREMLDRFGDERLALAAYNAGPFAVEKYGGIPPYQETQGYVASISRRVTLDTAATSRKIVRKQKPQRAVKRSSVKLKKDSAGNAILSN
jgi:soluble lytic murein transglycosylase-like protein